MIQESDAQEEDNELECWPTRLFESWWEDVKGSKIKTYPNENKRKNKQEKNNKVEKQKQKTKENEIHKQGFSHHIWDRPGIPKQS